MRCRSIRGNAREAPRQRAGPGGAGVPVVPSPFRARHDYAPLAAQPGGDGHFAWPSGRPSEQPDATLVGIVSASDRSRDVTRQPAPHIRRTARHPWRAANTNLQCDTQPGPRRGSPPPEHHPYLVQRDAMPKVGPPRVVAHCRWPGPTRPLTRSRSARRLGTPAQDWRRRAGHPPQMPTPLWEHRRVGLGCRANPVIDQRPRPPGGASADRAPQRFRTCGRV